MNDAMMSVSKQIQPCALDRWISKCCSSLLKKHRFYRKTAGWYLRAQYSTVSRHSGIRGCQDIWTRTVTLANDEAGASGQEDLGEGNKSRYQPHPSISSINVV